MGVMGVLWKISKWYNRYQFFMWASGVLTAIAAPLIGYAAYFLGINNQHAELVSDSPEYANDITAGSLIQWLTGQAHSYGRILGIIAIIGILLIIFCITFTIIGWISQRTEISGTDQVDEVQEKRPTQSRNGRTIRRLRANHGVLIIGKRIARRF